MILLVCLDETPVKNIPLWAALTDAMRAIPGLQVILAGSALAIGLMRRHPSVSGVLPLSSALDGRPYSWLAWRAARHARTALARSPAQPSLLIDPFGRRSHRRLARALAVRSAGMAVSTRADRDYSSVYPLPPALHAVQSVRVLFAAALGYSLHDLAPDFGLPLCGEWPADRAVADGVEVDLLVDWQAIPWTSEEQNVLKGHLAASGLRVVYLPVESQADDRLLENLPLLDSTRYLLSGNGSLAWFAAAIGKPGLCVCAAGTAKSKGLISTRFARQKMLNIDDPALTRPQVVAESIIQVLSRRNTALV
ncbi:hypothetical protein [Halothiobacillus sp. DCM-1]|uniref:hypothetical protein n=1 Tax=Halothiobacillus sp. DCM-1 TaxID=3112558 RepID=UPI0032461415